MLYKENIFNENLNAALKRILGEIYGVTQMLLIMSKQSTYFYESTVQLINTSSSVSINSHSFSKQIHTKIFHFNFHFQLR